MASRRDQEAEVVRSKFPPGTQEWTVDGVHGWAYDFRCAFGEPYTLFIHWEGGIYVVRALSPEAEKDPGSPHDKHLYDDGSLCLAAAQTLQVDFEDAYTRSVLWATGYTAYRRTGRFPFSLTNA